MAVLLNLVIFYLCLINTLVFGSGSFSNNVITLTNSMDKDKNGYLTKPEVDASTGQLDSNKDGCLTESEWSAIAVVQLGMTPGVSNAIFNATVKRAGGKKSGCGGLKVSDSFNTLPNTGKIFNSSDIPTKWFQSVVIQDVIDYCEMSRDRYLSVSECRQLPLTCQFSAVKCTYACIQFLLLTAKNRTDMFPFSASLYPANFMRESFYDAFERFLWGIDLDRDGQCSGNEVYLDDLEEDLNYDGCTDMEEFKAKFMFTTCNGYGLTEEMAENRFIIMSQNEAGARDPTCNMGLRHTATPSSPVQYSTETLVNWNLNALAVLCEKDRRLYQTNRDCNQLLRACTETRYKKFQACKDYINKVVSDKSGFFY